jgi:hypothetical protein
MTGYWGKSLIDWVESESKLQKRQLGSEMEFLDISLAKDSILHAIHTVRSTGEFKRRPYSTLLLIILSKKSAKQQTSSLFMNSIF